MERARTRGGARRARKEFTLAMVFVLPFTLGFLVFMLYPIAASLYYSLCNYHPLKVPVFIGIGNYVNLFKDPMFYTAVKNTAFMLLLGTPLTLAAALLLAVLLNRRQPLNGLFRTVMYIPAVVPTVVMALTWSWILNPEYGLLNSLLNVLGIKGVGWTSDPNYAKSALLMMAVWSVGNTMVLFLAALQDVPKDLYEAADIDGATSFRKFLSITVPCIQPVTMYNLITTVIAFMQYFTQGYVVNQVKSTPTLGAPLNSTMFLGTYLYQNAFSFFKIGYASAMAWILLILTLMATFALLKNSNLLDSRD